MHVPLSSQCLGCSSHGSLSLIATACSSMSLLGLAGLIGTSVLIRCVKSNKVTVNERWAGRGQLQWGSRVCLANNASVQFRWTMRRTFFLKQVLTIEVSSDDEIIVLEEAPPL